MRINLLPICSASETVPGSSTVTGWRCSLTTRATQIARPRRSMAACRIMAIRNIAAGEELCYDYCLYDGGDEEAPCNCGSRKCRGSMYSREELRRRRSLAKEQVQPQPSLETRKKDPKKSRPAAPKPTPRLDQQPRKLAEKKSTKNGLCLRPLGQPTAARTIAQESPGADWPMGPREINRLGSYTPE